MKLEEVRQIAKECFAICQQNPEKILSTSPISVGLYLAEKDTYHALVTLHVHVGRTPEEALTFLRERLVELIKPDVASVDVPMSIIVNQ